MYNIPIMAPNDEIFQANQFLVRSDLIFGVFIFNNLYMSLSIEFDYV